MAEALQDTPDAVGPRRDRFRDDRHKTFKGVLIAFITSWFQAFGTLLNSAAKWAIPLSFLAVTCLAMRVPIQAAVKLFGMSPLSSVNLAPLLLPRLKATLQDSYCDTIGIGCSGQGRQAHIGRFTRQVSTHALQAHDMFTSVVALSNPEALGLNHVEVWELAVAIQVSTGMPNREELGGRLAAFGDHVRDVKDAMYDLHAEGVSTFQSTLHRFKRLEKTIEQMQAHPKRYPASVVKGHLDDLYSHVDYTLSNLLRSVETAIPSTNRASKESGAIRRDLGDEQTQLKRAEANQPFWRLLFNSSHGKRLRADIAMTGISIDTIVALRYKLETTKSFLLSYRSQVGYFKSSFAGFHHGDHGLIPEDEALVLQDIMKKFEQSVERVRYLGTPEGMRETENAPWKPRRIGAR